KRAATRERRRALRAVGPRPRRRASFGLQPPVRGQQAAEHRERGQGEPQRGDRERGVAPEEQRAQGDVGGKDPEREEREPGAAEGKGGHAAAGEKQEEAEDHGLTSEAGSQRAQDEDPPGVHGHRLEVGLALETDERSREKEEGDAGPDRGGPQRSGGLGARPAPSAQPRDRN